MELRRWSVGGYVLVAVLASCGHTKNAPPPTPTEGETEDALAADIVQHHRYHHQGGLLMLLAMSLDALGLSDDEQMHVERIQADLLAKLRPAAHVERELMALLSAGVTASRIDRPEVDAALARLASASAAVHRTAIDDLQRLHGVLTPEQRAALIDRLRAHWALWKQANQGDETLQVSALGNELALSSEQFAKAKLELAQASSTAPLPDAAVDAQLDRFAKAFRADGFDARQANLDEAVDRDMTAAGATRLARFCEAINPVLSQDQRRNLAQILRDHGSHDDTQPEAP